ncbi:MAG: addiction module protein [Planctomycetota bacterium]
MGITLPLEKMTTEDKIRTMETIWDDLCKKAESIPSPSWHKDILEEREKAIENGKEEFIDWSEAKKQIEDKIS